MLLFSLSISLSYLLITFRINPGASLSLHYGSTSFQHCHSPSIMVPLLHFFLKVIGNFHPINHSSLRTHKDQDIVVDCLSRYNSSLPETRTTIIVLRKQPIRVLCSRSNIFTKWHWHSYIPHPFYRYTKFARINFCHDGQQSCTLQVRTVHVLLIYERIFVRPRSDIDDRAPQIDETELADPTTYTFPSRLAKTKCLYWNI